MRILVATVPAAGHFNPLTGPAVRLAGRGHDVYWYAGPQYADRVERLGLEVLPYREAVEITGENIGVLFPERQKLKGPKLIEFEADAFFARPARAQFHDIRDAHAQHRFDALLIDGGFYAGYVVAQRLDLPVFVVGLLASPTLRSDHALTPFFGLRPPRTIVGRAINLVAQSLVKSGSRKAVDTFNSLLDEEGLSPVSVADWFDCPLAPGVARRVFKVGLPGLDFPGAYSPPGAEWVGALLPHQPREQGQLDRRILERSGRVIVVSQGTVDNHDPRKLIIPTIEALRDTGHLVVVATGGIGTPELRSRYANENVMIEDFVDFAALFPHTRLYVTNGGLGGVLLALAHGVPRLVAGTREGKNDINARLTYRRLAVDLRTEAPTARAIARGAKRVLTDTDMQQRVSVVANELAQYDSVDIIERGWSKVPNPPPDAAPRSLQRRAASRSETPVPHPAGSSSPAS